MGIIQFTKEGEKITEITSIQIRQATKARLDKQKMYERETYDDVVSRLLDQKEHEPLRRTPGDVPY